MKTLRTPDDRFADLVGYDFAPHYAEPLRALFSDAGPITAGGERWFRRHVPGAAGQPHTTIPAAGHFLQEDAGPEVAKFIAAFVAAN